MCICNSVGVFCGLKYIMVLLIFMGVSFCIFCNIVYIIYKYKDVGLNKIICLFYYIVKGVWL